jgi:hypothetical protein
MARMNLSVRLRAACCWPCRPGESPRSVPGAGTTCAGELSGRLPAVEQPRDYDAGDDTVTVEGKFNNETRNISFRAFVRAVAQPADHRRPRRPTGLRNGALA